MRCTFKFSIFIPILSTKFYHFCPCLTVILFDFFHLFAFYLACPRFNIFHSLWLSLSVFRSSAQPAAAAFSAVFSFSIRVLTRPVSYTQTKPSVGRTSAPLATQKKNTHTKREKKIKGNKLWNVCYIQNAISYAICICIFFLEAGETLNSLIFPLAQAVKQVKPNEKKNINFSNRHVFYCNRSYNSAIE